MLDTKQKKRESNNSSSSSSSSSMSKSSSTVAEVLSTIIIAAYITAFESVTTDLFGFVPKLVQHFITSSYSNTSVLESGVGQQQQQLILHCGNFGILLLNSQWINIDGGQRALSMLEKMVEVTMMRGAQSGGVVTFEPSNNGVKVGGGGGVGCNPVIRGVRSRVVNAKRTVLSQGVRKKIEGDNCGMLGGKKLKGWNDVEFNATAGSSSGGSSDVAKRLVRGFFGHTRFATSSKASLDGTHPHQWTPRRTLSCYGFQSKEAALSEDGMMDESCRSDLGGKKKHHAVGTGMAQSVGPKKKVMRVKPMAQLMGVENFITHNGKLISVCV